MFLSFIPLYLQKKTFLSAGRVINLPLSQLNEWWHGYYLHQGVHAWRREREPNRKGTVLMCLQTSYYVSITEKIQCEWSLHYTTYWTLSNSNVTNQFMLGAYTKSSTVHTDRQAPQYTITTLHMHMFFCRTKYGPGRRKRLFLERIEKLRYYTPSLRLKHSLPFVCLLVGMSCISRAVLLCVNEGFTPLQALTDPPLISALHWEHYWLHIDPVSCLSVLCMWGDSTESYCLRGNVSLKSVLSN